MFEVPGSSSGVLPSATPFNAVASPGTWLIYNTEAEAIPSFGVAEVFGTCNVNGNPGAECLKVRKPTVSGTTNAILVPFGCPAQSAGRGTTDDTPDGVRVRYDPGASSVYDPIVGDFLGVQAGSWYALRGQPIGIFKVMKVDSASAYSSTGKTAMCRLVEQGPQLYKVTTGAVGTVLKARMLDSNGSYIGPEVNFYYRAF